MNNEEFEQIFEDQVRVCRAILVEKAAEYADDNDRMHNFNVAAELQGITREEALGGMMCKHTVSIYDMIAEGASEFSMEKWDEKITDHINYLILLRALVEEELRAEQADEAARWDGTTTVKFPNFNINLDELRCDIERAFNKNRNRNQ